MAIGGNVVIDNTANAIWAKASEQTWFREHANFVTSVTGFLATVLTWAATQSFAQSQEAQAVIFVVGFVLTCLGVKFTKNGWSQSQLKQVSEFEQAVATDLPLVENVPDSNQDQEVEAYLKRKFG